MSEEREIKSVIPTYYSFIMTGLIEFREKWAFHQDVEALDYALKLSMFLPTKLKDQIKTDKERIQKRITQECHIESFSKRSASNERDKVKLKIAREETEGFVDKIIRLLDSENLLTQQYGVPTRKKDLKNIGEILG